MMKNCEDLRGAISSLAINPFHTDMKVADEARVHIAACQSCHALYESQVAQREAMEKKGFDPTHQVV